MIVSRRVQKIKPSATLAVLDRAASMRAQGLDVISFGAGEPDFDTPDNIKNAAKKAIDSGFTKYCPVTGTPDLKQAIIKKFLKDNNLEYTPDQVIVSCGAKHSLYLIFQAIFDPGDEVIIPSPFWVSYPDMAMLADAVPKFVNSDESTGFKITAAQLEKAITPKTKAVIINSPSNPTGSAYTQDELKKIAGVCLKHKTLIVSDEIYEKLIYDNLKSTSIASVSKEVQSQTIVVNGVSKSYSMTGWRIGYAAGPGEIIEAMAKVQSQSTSNATSIALKATTEALNGPQDSVEMMRKEFEKRRNYIVERLNGIKGVKCLKPQGAFYAFPNFSGVLGKTYGGKIISTSPELAEYLLESVLVAAVAGDPFGAPGHLRFSYATSFEKIKAGMDRLQKALE